MCLYIILCFPLLTLRVAVLKQQPKKNVRALLLRLHEEIHNEMNAGHNVCFAVDLF